MGAVRAGEGPKDKRESDVLVRESGFSLDTLDRGMRIAAVGRHYDVKRWAVYFVKTYELKSGKVLRPVFYGVGMCHGTVQVGI
jgi:hypothetical protein